MILSTMKEIFVEGLQSSLNSSKLQTSVVVLLTMSALPFFENMKKHFWSEDLAIWIHMARSQTNICWSLGSHRCSKLHSGHDLSLIHPTLGFWVFAFPLRPVGLENLETLPWKTDTGPQPCLLLFLFATSFLAHSPENMQTRVTREREVRHQSTRRTMACLICGWPSVCDHVRLLTWPAWPSAESVCLSCIVWTFRETMGSKKEPLATERPSNEQIDLLHGDGVLWVSALHEHSSPSEGTVLQIFPYGPCNAVCHKTYPAQDRRGVTKGPKQRDAIWSHWEIAI